jgi:hypothetical protein
MPTTTTPTILDQINVEKTKVSERLARLDADRAKITTQLIDLETAERVLTSVSKTPPARRPRSASAAEAKAHTATRGRGRPPRAAKSKSAVGEPSARSLGLGERVLALATGKTRRELYAACPSDRPNHVGRRYSAISAWDGSRSATAKSTRHRPQRSRHTRQPDPGGGPVPRKSVRYRLPAALRRPRSPNTRLRLEERDDRHRCERSR